MGQGSGYFFYLGSPCSGGKLHYHGVAVNLLIHGAKRWSIFHPDHHGSQTCISPGSTFIQAQTMGKLPTDIAFIQKAQDIVILGSHFAHATTNLASTIGIAKVFEMCDTCFS